MPEQLSQIETPAVEQEEQQTTQTNPAAEAKARETGWVPLEEYKGDPAKWKPADKWKSPDEQIGTIRKRAELLEKKLAKEREDFAERIKRIEKMSAVALKAQRQEIEDKYASRIREAVKTGDEDALDKAEAAKAKALKNLDEEAAEAPRKDNAKSEFSPEDVEAVEDWKDANPWFDSNEEMRKFADRRFLRIRRRDPDMAMDDVLAEVRKAAEEQFPDEFKRKGNGASRVEGGARDMGGSRSGGFASLPAEARALADRFIKKDGLFLAKGETADKDLAKARERYAKKYLEDNQQ